MPWYWKEVDNKESATAATKAAVGISYFMAAVTGLLAFLSMTYRHPVMGLNGWSFVDAVLFTIIGWRISRLSRSWAITGLALYLLESSIPLARGGQESASSLSHSSSSTLMRCAEPSHITDS